MNSVILNGLKNMFLKVRGMYEESLLSALIEKIYTKISASWNLSGIVAAFKCDKAENILRRSLLSKIIYLPFSVVEYFNSKFGERLSDAIKRSAIIYTAETFINGFIALNTRFFGCMLLGMIVSFEVVNGSFSILSALMCVLAIALVCFNLNLVDFFQSSRIIGFCTSWFGFSDLKWDYYSKEKVKGILLPAIGTAFGVVCGLLPLKLGILVPFAFAGVGVVLMHPIVGVFCAIFAAPFVPTMLLAGLCVLTIGSVFIKGFTVKGFKWKRDGVGTGLGFFVLLLLISSVFSFSPKKSILVWGMYFIFIGFYYTIVNVVKTEKQLYGLLKIFAIAGLFVSIYGVLQYVFRWNVSNAWIDAEMFEEATMRAYSTMENPNVLGEYLLLLIPISAMLFLKNDSTIREKIVYSGTFLIGALCMIFTQSRGCWLGLMLAAAIFVTFYNGRLWALLPVAFAVLIFVMPQTMIDRMMSVGNMEDSSTSYRVFIWLGTFDLLKDYWIGGIGMGEGAFRRVYPLYSYNAIIAPHSHNTFLQLLVEGGIATLLTFLSIMVTFLKNMVFVFNKSEKGSTDAITALALGSAVSGFLLQSLFDYTFYNYRMMAMFFMVIAIGTALRHIKEEQNV